MMADRDPFFNLPAEFQDLPQVEALCCIGWDGKLLDNIHYKVDINIHIKDVVTQEVISSIIAKVENSKRKKDITLKKEIHISGKCYNFLFEILEVDSEKIQFLVSPCL
jgi:hypothetical protein